MITSVCKGLEASTMKVKAFRIVIKLTGDLTMRVKVARPLIVNKRGQNAKLPLRNRKVRLIITKDLKILIINPQAGRVKIKVELMRATRQRKIRFLTL